MGPAYLGLAAFQVISGLHQAELIRGQSRIDQSINEMNAKNIELDAWEAEKFGYTQSARYDSVVNNIIGEQRVGYAEQNVDVNVGTAKAVQEESKLTGFLNILDLQRMARNKALGLKNQASSVRLGSYMSGLQSDLNARSTEIGGALNAGATLISGYEKSYYKQPVKKT